MSRGSHCVPMSLLPIMDRPTVPPSIRLFGMKKILMAKAATAQPKTNQRARPVRLSHFAQESRRGVDCIRCVSLNKKAHRGHPSMSFVVYTILSFWNKVIKYELSRETGIEPATFDVTSRRSNQLNYPRKGFQEFPATQQLGATGFEPMTTYV